jgi:hypothetical protein
MYIPEEDVNESVARFNWFINNHRRDFRWDGGNINEIKTAKGNFYRNIGRSDYDAVYKHGFLLKGDLHEVYNSITIGETWTLAIAAFAGGNEHTVSRNNAADAFLNLIEEEVYPDYFEDTWTEDDDRAQYDWDIPGDDANNYTPEFVDDVRSMHELLRNPDDNDFRPRADAVELIDQGVPVTCTIEGVEVDVTKGYLGAAPDIGVYEYGDSTYWIGGRQEEQATQPIPSDGNTLALYDSDLMWLGGLGAVSYDIYLGTASNTLAFAGSQTNNIYNPGGWTNDQTYFWRIDSVLSDSSVVTGAVWTFTINDHAPQALSCRYSVMEDQFLAFELTGTDPDGNPLSYSVTTPPANGMLTGTAPNLVYTPNPDFNEMDFIRFEVNNGTTNSTRGIVIFDVEDDEADAPYFNLDPFTATTAFVGITYSNSIADAASDLDGQVLNYAVVSGPAWLNIATNGVLSGTPALMDFGINSWEVEATDPTGLSTTATLEIRVIEEEIVTLDFEDFGTDVVSNSLTAAGSTNDLTVAGIEDGNDYVYSVVYSGADIDGDGANDTLTYDVRVKGWSDGTSDAAMDVDGSTYDASATLGTTVGDVVLTSGKFTVGDSRMGNGQSLEFLLENLAVSLTDASMYGVAIPAGFNAARLQQTSNTGNSHQAIFGEGTGLYGVQFGTAVEPSFDVGLGALIISSDEGGGTRSTSWGVEHVDFSIEVELAAFGSYSEWVTAYGLIDDLASADEENEGLGDGYNNLVEYALGMNPTNSDAGSKEAVDTAVDGGTNYFEYVHNRRSDYTEQGLSYLLIDSTNLVGSVASTNAQDQIFIGPSVDGYEPVTNRYLTDDPAKFIELKIRKN